MKRFSPRSIQSPSVFFSPDIANSSIPPRYPIYYFHLFSYFNFLYVFMYLIYALFFASYRPSYCTDNKRNLEGNQFTRRYLK